jgi:indoleamine 2,3-dioxygenase
MDQQSGSLPNPRAHGVTRARGFLPDEDPLVSFADDPVPPGARDRLDALDALADALPDHLDDGDLRERTRELEPVDAETVDALTDRQLVRLRQLTGFLASAHVHAVDADSVDSIPEGLAVPLYEASTSLDHPPMLAYDTQALHNWRLRDPTDGVTIENVDPLVSFTDLDDEDWFYAVHVAIEAAGGRALVASGDAYRGVHDDDRALVEAALREIAESLGECARIMQRMTEGNDPDVFATDYRPYFDGFDDVVYEGVDSLEGPQSYRGGSGAQSSLLPALDGALDVEHAATSLIDHLRDMRPYMPPAHRELVAAFEHATGLRDYVADSDPDVVDAYNDAIDALHDFRKVHLTQVVQYIVAATGDSTGTGGTDFMEFLGTMRNETADTGL